MAKWPYCTRTWKQMRLEQLRKEPLCEYCPPNRRKPATDVDHKVAIRDGGGAFDPDNLASACHECHAVKTAHNEVLPGCDVNGYPTDPNHPWNKKK